MPVGHSNYHCDHKLGRLFMGILVPIAIFFGLTVFLVNAMTAEALKSIDSGK